MADDEEDKKDYEVGYGKTPIPTRYKPGQSGNLKGRPRDTKNFKTALEDELKTRVEATENGKRKKITKREVIAKQLVNKAAKGDHKATALLFSETRTAEEESGAISSVDLFAGQADAAVMEGLLQRIRQTSPSEPDKNQPEYSI